MLTDTLAGIDAEARRILRDCRRRAERLGRESVWTPAPSGVAEAAEPFVWDAPPPDTAMTPRQRFLAAGGVERGEFNLDALIETFGPERAALVSRDYHQLRNAMASGSAWQKPALVLQYLQKRLHFWRQGWVRTPLFGGARR
jgi:hypothetical protein